MLEEEQKAYNSRKADSEDTADKIDGILFSYLGKYQDADGKVPVTALVQKLSKQKRQLIKDRLKAIGLEMNVVCIRDGIEAETVMACYDGAKNDIRHAEDGGKRVKGRIEEITGNEPQDGIRYNADERAKNLQEQAVTIGVAIYSRLQSAIIRQHTLTEITAQTHEYYLKRSEGSFKKVLYTNDTYYQNTALTPGIEPKDGTEKPKMPSDDGGQAGSDTKPAGDGNGGAVGVPKKERYYEYVTMRDGDVCGDCEWLDGKIFKYSEAVVGANYPPLHPNCRCVAIEIKEGGDN